MFGWRKRIGGISPTVMEVIPYDFYRMVPDGIGLVGITSNIEFWDEENFDRAFASLEDGARYLGSRAVDYVIHFGAPLVAARGHGFDAELIAAVEARAGVPATTSIRSAVEALRVFGARKVAVASPYPEEVNRNVAAFLEADGFEVVGRRTRDVVFKRLQDVHSEDIYRFACETAAGAPGAEALYIPCPQWPAADAVEAVERDCGLPVVASDPADFWAAFRALGLRLDIRGFGRLLAGLAEA